MRTHLAVTVCICALAALLLNTRDGKSESTSRASSITIAPMGAGLNWPAVTNVTRPWTRWWWLGSAVDKENITRLLEAYQAAGLGGVEITCIYGVKGAEDRELPYLSENWLNALRYTLHEADRLGMQVDLPTGSGWRTGGPSVTDEDANATVVVEHEALESGGLFRREFPDELPQALVAYGEGGAVVDLLRAHGPQVENSIIEWQVPAGKWTLYTLTQKWSRDNVKRPAPGGEGKNINPLSKRSLMHFLDWFGEKLDGLPSEGLRCQFHDSYEYEGNWCDDFLAEFAQRRGYRLEEHLPAFDGQGDPEEVARVKHDYRETVSDLVLEDLIEPWTAWSHEHGMLSRNQSHGSPANWLDLYAACDIPETESFGRIGGKDSNPLGWRFASSAAHVAGKPLVSAESCTWLNEHFQETLAEMKTCLDGFFLAGINHVIYQGTAYSPQDAVWPGWLFYASTEVNPQNPIWRDLPALNEYVTRCQSVLQSTKPDNDILLYWPIHDYWTDAKGLRKDIRVHNVSQWFDNDFGKTAKWLDGHGYTFDYVSDRQLVKCRVVDGRIETQGGAKYATILIPRLDHMPLTTLRKLDELAKAGATIAFESIPTKPAGMADNKSESEFRELTTAVNKELSSNRRTGELTVVNGKIIDARQLPAALEKIGLRGERWSESGQLQFHRRAWSGGNVYFIKNMSGAEFDGLIAPIRSWQTAEIMDPLDGRVGLAKVDSQKESQAPALRLQLAPGQTVFVKTYRDRIEGAPWHYRTAAPDSPLVRGPWDVEFIAGGPELPPPFTTRRMESWTELAGTDGERFAGTARYSTTFTPETRADRYLLDLGNVAESARVELNGKPVATLFAPPFQVELDDVQSGENRLVVDVTNVAANRIRDLDRRGVQWRIFKDINLVNINYKPFDASNWPVRDAGLLGPVTLTPLKTD